MKKGAREFGCLKKQKTPSSRKCLPQERAEVKAEDLEGRAVASRTEAALLLEDAVARWHLEHAPSPNARGCVDSSSRLERIFLTSNLSKQQNQKQKFNFSFAIMYRAGTLVG